jgi:uncharacterized repeat protein (TIGR03803 family)
MKSSFLSRLSTLTLLSAVFLGAAFAQVAKMPPQFKTIYAFDSTHGATPYGTLLTKGSYVIGTTHDGGDQNMGVVFRFSVKNQELKILHQFHQDGVDGFWSDGGIASVVDNGVVGVTPYGGSYYSGVAYGFDAESGVYKVLHSFTGGATDGAQPTAAVVPESATSALGTAQFGGNSGFGTVFRMTDKGVITVLHSFNGVDGRIPQYGLTKGPDGAYYGVTNFGGDYDTGTVYRIDSQGTFRTVVSFQSATTGTYPSRLTLGKNGVFYGTNSVGGAGSGGTAFSVTINGALTVLHNFSASSAEGDWPNGLTLGSDGLLYGTTANWGSDQLGSVFQMTTSGVVTVLHKFNPWTPNNAIFDGSKPYSPPIEVSPGVFVGATTAGGAANGTGYGTLYKITK